MEIKSTSFSNGDAIDARFAFAKPDPETHVTFADNVSPHLKWSDAPEGTRSFVLLCVDGDVPSVGDDVNQEDRTVSADLPRTEFYHWVMVDIPPSVCELDEGACARGVVAKGKSFPTGPEGARQGVNDFTSWFAGDADMGGIYKGYDGPAPPWNDELVHRYHFIVMATDLQRCPVEGDFFANDVQRAIEGHVLAVASIMGTYTQNPSLAT